MIRSHTGIVVPGSPRNMAEPARLRWHQSPCFVEQPGIRLRCFELFEGRPGDRSGHPGTKALTNVITALGISVQKYFVTGASEGGAIAAISLENDPTYRGGVAVCGPIGSFRSSSTTRRRARSVRLLFPGVLRPDAAESAIDIPPALVDWQRCMRLPCPGVSREPSAMRQLLSTAQKPIGRDLRIAADAITECSVNIFGQTTPRLSRIEPREPYDNIGRIYLGSSTMCGSTRWLSVSRRSNRAIHLEAYETTGNLTSPDDHAADRRGSDCSVLAGDAYNAKVASQALRRSSAQIPVLAYWHCTWTPRRPRRAVADGSEGGLVSPTSPSCAECSFRSPGRFHRPTRYRERWSA